MVDRDVAAVAVAVRRTGVRRVVENTSVVDDGLASRGLDRVVLIRSRSVRDGLVGNGLVGNWPADHGLVGDGLIGDGLVDDGLIGDGLVDDGLVGAGVTRTVAVLGQLVRVGDGAAECVLVSGPVRPGERQGHHGTGERRGDGGSDGSALLAEDVVGLESVPAHVAGRTLAPRCHERSGAGRAPLEDRLERRGVTGPGERRRTRRHPIRRRRPRTSAWP
ncbi:hypothetical protein [Curtobacterium sp. MCPF17_052]|uniref:hypothetical protein n=1 Tax=Curtobacterium sp. MCPF17_052 TaxID=2175655 RepID=UPI0024DF7F16|nr:hypothetical protein [Curtobacterium sp. MCPF17_052]WIB12808.1 hypothetical protein DEJ36_01685 [Curtobacterium sp. MCPF17_052]